MAEETSFLFAEYAKPVAHVGKNRRTRYLLFSCYILFAVAYAAFFFAITVPQVVALLPLFLWILIHYTIGTVNYEYCVRVDAGKVSFLKLRGKKEKPLLSLDCKSICYAMPQGENLSSRLAEEGSFKTLDLRADPRVPEYALLYESSQGRMLVLFAATHSVINAMHYYNKSVTVDKTFLKI